MSKVQVLGFFLLNFLLSIVCNAQTAELPAMQIETMEAKNTIKWVCQFDGVKSIAIQRSADSVKNFVTVGVIPKPKKGPGTYIDSKPMIGKNYYRLSINFVGDVEWFSNTYKVFLDSATLAKSIEGAIVSGTTNSTPPDKSNSISTNSENEEFTYHPSARVYTNPYTGHININMDEVQGKRYSVRFYTPDKEEVLRVGRITKKVVVVDKNNFNSTGIYIFELYEGNNILETGYVKVY